MKGYRTLIFAFLLAFFGTLHTMLPGLREAIPAEYYGIVFALIGAIVAGLRVITSTPVFSGRTDETS